MKRNTLITPFSYLCSGIAILLPLAIVANSSMLGPPTQVMYQWHDSSKFSRVIVNATQGIEIRPRVWFAQDRLVTDFTITNASEIGREKAQKQYQATRQLLISYGIAVGTYTSGTTVKPEREQTYWPLPMVPLEQMPSSSRYKGTWPGEPSRRVIDVSDPATRRALQQSIRRLWQQFPAPVRFVDNAAAHSRLGGSQNWSDYCANIKEIRIMGAAMGSRQIFNVAVRIGSMSDQETLQLMDAVGDHGIALEMPWERGILQTEEGTKRTRNRYRQMLDSGMGVVMVPVEGDPKELVEWVRTWRKPTDHLYLSGVFYKSPDQALFGPGH